MSEAATALRKKVAPSRAATPGSSTVTAMLRKVMPRVADQALSLDLMLGDVRFGMASKAEVLDGIGDNDLVYLMEDEAEVRGICALSPGLLSAVIEIQVAGRVTSASPIERPTTRTDGIVAAHIVDCWIEAAIKAARDDDIDDALPLMGYRRLERVLTKRNADLALDPVDFRTMSVELSLGDGAKEGRLTFALPPRQPEKIAVPTQARMHRHLSDMEAPMVAILTRMPVAMDRVKNMAVGDVFDVPISALLNVQLEGRGGQKIAAARLGQLNGKKAVRLVLADPNGDAPGAETSPNLDMLGTLPGVPAEAAISPSLDLPSPDVALPSDATDGLPDLPELPGEDSIGDLPDLPQQEDAGVAGLPDLPDLPELPELPDLPDLPK